MNLTDIAPLETWAELEEKAWEKFNLQSSVFNKKGIRITDTKNWSNRICPKIKSTDKGQSFICATAHMNLAGQAEKTKSPVIEECDAGLLKIVVPIFAGTEFLGVAGGCGLLPEEGEVDSFAVNKITDIDEASVKALSGDIPEMTDKEARDAAAFFSEKIRLIVDGQG
ncbi:PocR ligand-binding domain-containing protein [Desulfospira joergensenii]|uniref:PocR ligand-binding domain-containing protein n=1 Tax=Desulfospira joergensenii TaxID=53329 RepID=UPI0003B4758F|nr:PocR ligand-binding domain-containing protein [Desulfospira joergensenii]